PFRREGAFAEAGDGHRALERVLALDRALVGDVDLVAGQVAREPEREVVALDRAGEVDVAQLARVVAGELVAVLLERDGRRAGTGVGLDGERPFAGQVDLRSLREGQGRDEEDAGERARTTEDSLHSRCSF